MSVNDDILSRELKHRALLSLYEKKLDNDLTKIMSSHKKRLVSSTLKNGNKNVNALNRALRLETRKTYRKIYKDGISELKALANTSSKFHNNTLKESLGKIYRSKVYSGLKVNDLIINSAGTYSQQIASISLSQQRRIKDIIKKGMMENLAVNQIAKNVGNSIDLPSAQLKTLTRTAITETSTSISNATYKLNEDVIDGYQYVATLDARTSLICGRLDGKVFRLDDKRGIRPPQHFNCRSTTVPIVKSYEDLRDTKSSRISKRRLSRVSKSKRASLNGQVPSETNFAKFLSEQDYDFKLAVLGDKRRVEIFNTGKLKFNQFSTKDGRLVSISKLEELLNGAKTKPPTVTTELPKIVVKNKSSNIEIGYLLNRGSAKLRKSYDDDFNSQLNDQQKTIVNKLDKPKDIRNSKNGVYYAQSQRLQAELNARDGSKYSKKSVKSYVIAHEYGHHIDYVSNNSRFISWSESNQAFKDAIIKDRKLFFGSSKFAAFDKILKKLANKKTVEIYSKYDKTRVIAKTQITDLRGNGFGEVSDIVDALARGSFRRDYNMYGHSISYWKRPGAIEKEIFANLFATRHDKKAYELVKSIIPNTVKEFEKRLLELEKL